MDIFEECRPGLWWTVLRLHLSDYILVTRFKLTIWDWIAVRHVSFSVHHIIIIGAVELDNLIKVFLKSHHILFSAACQLVVVTGTSSG